MPGPVRAFRDTRPALTWEDGFVAGNGEQGLLVFGPPGRERLVHTHHRFVLPNASARLGPPQTAARLEHVRDLLLAGRRKDAQRAFSDGRGLAWTQAFHPGPVLHVEHDGVGEGFEGGAGSVARVPQDYLRRTDLATGELTTSWAAGGAAYRQRAFVSRPDRVAVVELTGDRLDITLRLSGQTPGLPDDVLVAAWADGDPAAAGSGRHEVTLALEATYPDVDVVPPLAPLGFVGVTRVVVDGGCVRADGDRLLVRGATTVVLLTRLARWSGRPRTRRLRTGLAALPADYEVLLARHAPAHAALIGRCTLTLEPVRGVPGQDTGSDDPEPLVGDLLARADGGEVLDPTLVQALFATGRHLLLSSCGVLPPRLTGLWLGAWGAAWSGDFTTDANLNLQVAGLTTTGMPELLAGYVALLAAQVDDWRANARAVYGARGFLAPSRTDGEHGRLFHVDDDWPWTMWLAGADWLLLPLVEYWQATGDDTFLAGVLAPWLAEAATFFEGVLTRMDADGRWVLVPSWSPEVGPVTEGGPGDDPGVAGINATMDVAAARHALTTAADAVEHLVEHLGGDLASVNRWRALAARLPDHRVDADGALAEWAWPGLESAPDHRHVSHLYPVWPLHEITPDATPELAGAAVRALQRRGDEDFSAHGSLHRALAAARLKRADLARANLLKILGRRMLHRSLVTSHYPDLRVYNADAALCLPAVVVELLLDSGPGVIELLPALPPEWPSGRLTGSPTRAGVVVEELTWDLRRGEVRAVLRSPVAREIDVVCRAARDGEGDGSAEGVRRRVTLAAGQARDVVVAVGV